MAQAEQEIKRISFPSGIEYLDKVEAITVKVTSKLGFTESDSDDMSIAVTEMFNNAIHHGNKYDQNKKVTICFTVKADVLVISIRDQGSGFIPEQIKDPLAPENLLSENGRGIYLVRHLMDDVRFNIDDQGSEVLLYKALPKQ